MGDPRIREVDRVEDIDGQALVIGVNYDAVTLGEPHGKTWVFTRTGMDAVDRALNAASWEAADQGGRMAAEL